jgi:hypothetical protein
VVAITKALDNHDLTAFIVHLAEGKPNDPNAAREFRMLRARGFLRPGLSIIHGTALRLADFQELARAGVGLIWSPRSNIELYGDTTDVRSAKLAKSLEDKKYLVREVREANTNRFHLTKLMAALVGLKKTTAPTKSSKKTEKGS